MARVNHKKIKQLIAQKQSKITDRQFFTSRILATHFADIAAAQSKRYGYRRRVKVGIVWKPKEELLARTNNAVIEINAGNPMITKHKGRQSRYEHVCGMFAHELGHVLYTDFLSLQSCLSFQDSGTWYPEPPPLRNLTERNTEEELWEYQQADPRNKMLLSRLTSDILNVLEDGYIENRMLMDYPGILGDCLHTLRSSMHEDSPTVEDHIDHEEDGGHIWMTIRNIMLSYMRWGEVKYGGTPLTDERIQTVFGLLSDLDMALVSRDYRDRCRVANLILIRCWKYIKDFMEFCKEQAENSASDGSGDGSSAEDLLSKILSALAGSSAEASGDTSPVGDNSSSGTGSTATGKQRAATAALAASSGASADDNESEDGASGAGSGSEETEEKSENETQSEESAVETKDDAEGSGGASEEKQTGDLQAGGSGVSTSHQNVSEQEGGRIPLTETSDVFAPEGGDTEQDEEYEGSGYTGAAADIERLLNRIASDSVTTELERQRTEELTELAQSISYGDIHEGVSKKVHRIASVKDELKDEYHEIAGDLLHISKQLQKSVLQQMQDSRRGGKQTSLLMGRRLDSHALFRTDSRVFYKNALPNETPQLCVGLLLDESGSMSWGDRATYARATAIILYDFCQALGIPITVYGHSTSGGVDLYSYAEFDAIDRDDRYRLMDISARGSNRDGAALRYVAEQMVRRPEDIKLLMLVSDGQPADYGYMGTAAEEDLRGIKHEYQRKGILFVAAAIGSDKENIERIYGDSYLDITDLTKLPVKLAGIIKRFIRF